MSAIGFLILLVLSIVLLMVLIMKIKLHPTFSLFVAALVMGLVMGVFEPEGFTFTEVLSKIASGFGGTLGSMGIPIMLGAILAMGVQDTGAAKVIANFFIKLFRGKNLELSLGFSHPVVVEPPEGIKFECPAATKIVVSGVSKEAVGAISAKIRDYRKPEPYKGKGIKYEGEFVRRKVGKAGAKGKK